ncbi:MAG: ATP-binding cassette domain-containing protein [Ruminococcaceae bacterium]|nr:ATP-binding cassette domain-containing protein [Oscillospiraceae bacterium]
MEYVLQAEALTKSYRGNRVLNGVSMNIQRGDIYGFVGENGSGKTTVIRLITGLIYADSGEFTLFGTKSSDPTIRTARARVGAIVESPSIYLNMSAKENLLMQNGILGIRDEEKCKTTLETVGLGDLWDSNKRAGDFSLGMRQRLGIAMALLGDPEFIILDEPMNGLDPAGIVEIRELILHLNRNMGITFLISSHILTELSLVATRYGIISRGRILQEISAEELEGVCRHTTVIKVADREALLALLSADFDNTMLFPLDGGVRIEGDIDLNAVLGKIIDAGITITAVNTHRSSIEDYYLSMTGGGRRA